MAVEVSWSLREQVQTSRGANPVRQVWFPSARGPYEMVGHFALPPGVAQSSPPTPLQVIATVNIANGSFRTVPAQR
jgi:hypothetical protein